MSTSVATTPVPISIFDETDSLVAIVGLYESAFFERDWQTAGTFQITINLNIPSASEFKRGRTVLFGQDRRRFGIITETIDNIDEKGKGNETRTVYGYEIKKILDWRMVQPPAGSDYFHYNTFAETVMHNLVKYNADPSFVTDTLRGFYRGDTVALGAMLVQESDQGRGPTYLLNSRWNTTILEELAACALATGWGSWVEFNAVGGAGFNWIFRTSGGVDRTASQSVNNRVIFNTDYGTLRTAQATDSDVTYKSLAYVGGQGQGAARTIRTVYDGASAPTSRLRKEMFVDARDLSANADLDSRGALKLSQNYFQIFLDASSLAVSSVVFGVDYDLGDTCTVTQFGMSVDEQITKVRESWSANSYQVDLTFDRKYAEITSLVKSNNTTLQTALSASEVPALVGGYMLVSDSSGHTVESNIAYSPGALTLPTLYGSASASGTLTLSSTSNATKGKILFGTSAYDEVNNMLGIGTTSPLAPLEVNGVISAQGSIKLTSDAGYIFTQSRYIGSSNGAILYNGGTGNNFGLFEIATNKYSLGYSTNHPYLAAMTNPMITLDCSTSYVGIGTTSPGVMLELGYTSHGYIRFAGPTISVGNIYHDSTYGLHLDTYSNNLPIRIDGSQLILGMTGNVGIGTTSPLAPLEVNGVISAQGSIKLTSDAGYIFTQSRYIGSSNGAILYNGGTGNNFGLFEIATNKYSLGYSTNHPYLAAMTNPMITLDCSTSYVGIGTASPGCTLDVNGSTRIAASFACNGATPQAAYNSGGALAAYATGSYGFDTEAHASSLYAMVVSIRAALVADGIMS